MHRAILVSLVLVPAARAEPVLPVVADVEWGPFRTHCCPLLEALGRTDSPLPPETTAAVQALLDRKTDDLAAAAREVQRRLDPYCLLAVDINPESRVKAARGPAAAELRRGRTTVVLLKVHNDGGVTHRLRLGGPGIKGDDSWLRAEVVADAPFGPRLSGRRLEYRLLRLTPRQSGKREATFQFDVGQGTQDLGFRAEVPVLFTVREPKRE